MLPTKKLFTSHSNFKFLYYPLKIKDSVEALTKGWVGQR